MFMPRVVVLWHRTGFIRRRSPTCWCIGCYTLARHLTRLGKTTFPTINIATVPWYTHAVRQPMPTTHDGATASLICGKGDSNRRDCSLKDWHFHIGENLHISRTRLKKNWKPYIHVPYTRIVSGRCIDFSNSLRLASSIFFLNRSYIDYIVKKYIYI